MDAIERISKVETVKKKLKKHINQELTKKIIKKHKKALKILQEKMHKNQSGCKNELFFSFYHFFSLTNSHKRSSLFTTKWHLQPIHIIRINQAKITREKNFYEKNLTLKHAKKDLKL